MFVLKIDTDNAAFEDGLAPYEVARILRAVADKVVDGVPPQYQTVRDANGNDVGRFKLDGAE